MRALQTSGFEVELAASLRSYEGRGDAIRQQRLRQLGERLSQRLIRRYQRAPLTRRPALWLTYHLYHKAPDHIGPAVAEALGIPYVVVEASVATKQQHGRWHAGYQASIIALQRAALAICLNPVDRRGLTEAVPTLPQADLPPFIDLAPFESPGQTRRQLAKRFNLDSNRRWLLCVAMMRPGDKLASYRLLADCCHQLAGDDWQLLVVGDGDAASEVRSAFANHPAVRLLGQQPTPTIAALGQQAELLLWPAVNEAFGIALLEAQASGCAVIAGREGGVAAVVADGQTGVLTEPRSSTALARTTRELLDRPQRLAELRRCAAEHVRQCHSLEAASQRLRTLLQPLL
nr:glycosyltransferase family 4 protein [Motiliproteus sediminis]